MHDDPVEFAPVLGAVGPRLRALRQDHEWTLADLAVETGISVSTLSRLESGHRRPTLELLLPLARAHQVSLDELVDTPEQANPRVHAHPVSRNGMTVIPLTRRRVGIQAMKLLLPVGHGRQSELQSHEGYEWLYVLDGRLGLRLGSNELVLVPGEAAEFDTRTPHAMANAGDVTAEILILLGPQGERAHLRARPAARRG